MRTYAQIISRMRRYKGARLIYFDYGYIAWQIGTGENVEILFIEVRESRKGYGSRLLKAMKNEIHPYHSVYVFRRAINTDAGKFYRALGFTETRIKNLYKNEDAVLGVIPFDKL